MFEKDLLHDSIHDDRYWEQLDKVVARYETEKVTGADVLEELLSGVNEDFRKSCLVELIKLDQEQRWSLGSKIPIEDYLVKFVEIDERQIAELLVNEIELRQAFNESPQQSQILERFPQLVQCPELVGIISQSLQTHQDSNSISVDAELLTSLADKNRSSRPKTDFVLAPGTLLGRYTVLSVLGRGGMGVVYLARDSELDRFVAIKLLQPTVVGLGESGDMLLQEARTAAKLRHPNIIPVFDIGKTESGAHYVVMEYMDGKPLDEVVRNRQFSSSEACEIVMAVTKALDAAHQCGFIHRDIKPANILIDSAGHVKISDFGLAIRQSEQTTDALIGTVPYMAPEQVGKEFGDVGFSTDIWAVGIVFYELLSGRASF